MTNEERQRTMNFILEQQAQLTASVQRHEEELQRLKKEAVRERPRNAELRESFQILVKLSKIYDYRLDKLEFGTENLELKTLSLEDANKLLARLIEKNTARLDKLESRS